jgi:hypothetical protein
MKQIHSSERISWSASQEIPRPVRQPMLIAVIKITHFFPILNYKN